jgi:hypothetical protein
MGNPIDTQDDRPNCWYGKDHTKATVKAHSLLMRLEDRPFPPGEPIGESSKVGESEYAHNESC